MFPPDERFGLCAQVRRSAVSVAANIVEGCARKTTREYLQFINISTGSAAETAYLIEVSNRLGFLKPDPHKFLSSRYTQLVKELKKLLISLDGER